MSWLNNITDLAGKAESFLNNIDQSAAVAISKASGPSSEDSVEKDAQKRITPKSTHDSSLSKQHDPLQSDIHEQNKVNIGTSSDAPKLSRAKQQTLRRENQLISNQKEADDALFDFLNSNQKVEKPRATKLKIHKKVKEDQLKNKPVISHLSTHKDITGMEMSRNSSYDSLISKKSGRKVSDNGSVVSDRPESYSEHDVSTFPTDSTASESEFEMVASLASKDSDRYSPASSNQEALQSDFAVENKLLKTELSSLHQELTQTAERHRKIKEELQHNNNELLNQCEDLQEELKVKNSQFSALHLRVLETEKLLELERNNNTQLRAENERILIDQSEGSGMHARTIDELRSRLNEVETVLAHESHAHNRSKQEVLDLRMQRDSESKKVVESLQKAEAEKQAEKKRIEELILEVRTLTNNYNLTKQELADYKQKAARILQSKERLIASLKGSGESEMTSSTIATLELSEIKQERDALKEDLHAAKLELFSLRSEFQDAEQQFQQDQSLLQQEINSLRRDLDDEVQSRHELESQLHRLQEEGRRDREDHARARTLTQSRLHDKDTEIERLRNQLMIRSQSTPQESELESRLRQLTEAVIQKQSLVETLSAEKSSLLLQLERMEGQVKRLSQEGGNHVNVRISEDDARSSSNVLFSSHGPGVVGRVRKAASALDQFSIRLGIFLKRYPPARLFFLIYMGVLHIWVMIVLLTYTPEEHDEEFLKTLKQNL